MTIVRTIAKSVALRRGLQESDADDVAQEVCLALLGRQTGPELVRAVATRRAIDLWRKRQAARGVVVRPGRHTERERHREYLREWRRRRSELSRKAVVLSVLSGKVSA